jgi:recombination protein U
MKNTNYANRGKGLESLVKLMCDYYFGKDIALITKIPTPFKVLGMHSKFYFFGHYNSRSTVDFEGIMRGGRHIAFDCKEIKGTRFPFAMIKPHQFIYLQEVKKMGGIAFILIYFKDENAIVRIDIDIIKTMQDNISNGKTKKSFNYNDVKKLEIKENEKGSIDFLQGYY